MAIVREVRTISPSRSSLTNTLSLRGRSGTGRRSVRVGRIGEGICRRTTFFGMSGVAIIKLNNIDYLGTHFTSKIINKRDLPRCLA